MIINTIRFVCVRVCMCLCKILIEQSDNKSSSPAPNITEGLLVFVQLVIADITTEPTEHNETPVSHTCIHLEFEITVSRFPIYSPICWDNFTVHFLMGISIITYNNVPAFSKWLTINILSSVNILTLPLLVINTPLTVC